MREIKFRMWDTEQKGWVMPPNHQTSSVMPLKEAFDTVGKNPKILELGEHTGRYILMQYTNLKDKNGVEIYEGDIVRWTSWSIRSGHEANKISEVIWSVGAWRLSGDETWVLAIYTNIEVIGNIYQHPHLLKGATK